MIHVDGDEMYLVFLDNEGAIAVCDSEDAAADMLFCALDDGYHYRDEIRDTMFDGYTEYNAEILNLVGDMAEDGTVFIAHSDELPHGKATFVCGSHDAACSVLGDALDMDAADVVRHEGDGRDALVQIIPATLNEESFEIDLYLYDL